MATRTLTHKIVYSGFRLDIRYTFSPGRPATRIDPPEPAEIEIVECWLCLSETGKPGSFLPAVELVSCNFLTEFPGFEEGLLDELMDLDPDGPDEPDEDLRRFPEEQL